MQSFQFHPVVARWFEQKFGTPTEPQARGWPAIQSGGHTLIAAPTGSGKTLAAFFASLDQLFREGLAGQLPDETRVVYVSPLKALSNDIHKNLEQPLAGIRAALLATESREVGVRAEVRTGDTPPAKRQALIRKPPHLLVTTPESLYLLLTSQSGRKLLRSVRTLIVDEIHALVGNRRGSHLALSMERLAALVGGPMQRIGLSATQKPIDEVARFLVGGCRATTGQPPCTIIDAGHRRELDLGIELPGSPLEAVMSNEVWAEVYQRLAELVEAHRTTLVFVNTRRLAERVTHHLAGRLGNDKVASHHGSLSAKLRLEAELRLKRGELKALVATASLELGIDIGSVDLVCQLGPTRSITTCLQRAGRAEHRRGGLPKARLFPLSRDELVECLATLRCVRSGELDNLHIPARPLDVLAQQIVACAADQDWDTQRLFDLMRSAYPYRDLAREEFDEVVRMLAEGFSTKRGRRGALIHHDAVNQRVRARRGARWVALTSGGAIPDNADYRVVLEPAETFLGTVNEDFAVESMAGDIFQLGNASWRIVRINSGTVRVEDAHGQPPGIPFWLGEAPGRTAELSRAVAELRREIELRIEQTVEHDVVRPTNVEGRAMQVPQTQSADTLAASCNSALHPEIANRKSQISDAVACWLISETGLSEPGATQLADYFIAGYRALGVIPSQHKIVMERFFDESGGMQLVIHSPFGIRLNRAWGLALRKRFCRSFNFELQAAATDDAIVLSLGTQHSFPLEEVFHYLNSRSVRELLVQALLDAPMFAIRWRWNVTRALALPRQRGGHKVPAPLQRMESENLLAAVFPDQLACLENIAGDRVVPDHPLVRQTIEDCLTEAMDVEGLITLLERIESGFVQCVARDLPEPSPLAHEIIHARPYAFLDNAPLEERRTQAVYTRRASQPTDADDLGALDRSAIARVCAEAWPRAANPDELHDALLLMGVMTDNDVQHAISEATAAAPNAAAVHAGPDFEQTQIVELSTPQDWLEQLVAEKRAGRLTTSPVFWVAAERLPMVNAVYPDCAVLPVLIPPASALKETWDHESAVRELVRGRLEVIGPVTADALAEFLHLPREEIDVALIALETEGFVLRGRFHPNPQPGPASSPKEIEWCDRRLLARIHRLTINRLRAEIQPVSLADFQRFLLAWQRADADHQVEGLTGLEAVLEFLDGYQLPAAAWEPEVLALRVKRYTPEWLDQLCFSGRIGWGRLTPPPRHNGRPFAPVRSSPVSIFVRDNLPHWLALSAVVEPGPGGIDAVEYSADTARVLETFKQRGALFFGELVKQTGLLPSRIEQALAELTAHGLVSADSFEGLRALLVPAEKRVSFVDPERRRRHRPVTSVEFAGRWSLLREPSNAGAEPLSTPAHSLPLVGGPQAGSAERAQDTRRREDAIEAFARVLLRRYGIVFRRMLERESLTVSWFELVRIYRRLEARGEIRGGHFVSGVSGEQFALPEAIGLLRSIRKEPGRAELITICGADPLNATGILTPGPRVAAITANRILLRDGVPIAALEAGRIIALEREAPEPDNVIEHALRVGSMPALLRPYY